MLLLKNAHVFSPSEVGKRDILICSGKIVSIEKHIPEVSVVKEVVDLKGKVVVPGFIDLHIHFAGAGGEGGPLNRTPWLTVKEIAGAGITTAVGLLGTDGWARSLLGLLQKAYALDMEGISTYIYVGSYQMPVVTITGSIATDIIAIEKVVGVGEIAIGDHRSSWPTVEELSRVASEVRVAAMLSGKVGVVHLHTGSYGDPLVLVKEVLKNTDIPAYHFLPTHMNRNESVLDVAMDYAINGGFVDLTAVTKELPASVAVVYLVNNGVDIQNITISSDGGGSLPRFDEKGNLKEMGVASPKVLLEEFVELEKKIGLEDALRPFTVNPALRLGLESKGRIEVNMDADILVFDGAMELETVIARGRKLV